MKIRPILRPGAIVKLSKKGKKYSRTFSKASTLVVSNVYGNGSDRISIITCRIKTNNKYKEYKFYRPELWYTGKNVFTLNLMLPSYN